MYDSNVMQTRKRRNNSIKNAEIKSEDLYSSWYDEASKAAILKKSPVGEGIAHASYGGSYRDIDTRTSVRQEFTRDDYDFFRPSESLPKSQTQTIAMSMAAYKKVGLIRNIIDLMSDFTCQGISLVHNSTNVQKFYKEWFQKINGDERSERFVNTLLRCGTTVVKWSTAKLSAKQADKLQRSLAADLEPDFDNIDLEKREIPWRYTILNPLSLEVIGGEIASFVGKYRFNLKLPQVSSLANKPQLDALISELPADIQAAIKDKKRVLPLDPTKTQAFYYKKDDWEIWADSMIAAILSDIIMLGKLKLADMAALDGAISRVRLWKLGNLEHKIMPNQAAIDKLANELTNNVGGGTFDLIWNPAIELFESSSDVSKFLGEEKYKPTWNAIYSGLGIPPTLTGSSTSSGFTNNYISLKTLVERLNYARSILLDFWNYQIKLVQKAMGFRFPAEVQFDHMTLSDEAAEKQLLISLIDRDIISAESVQEVFGLMPELEKNRLNKEKRSREKGTLPHKASQWHNPEKDFELRKISLTSGIAAPSQVGLDLKDKKSGEVPALKMKQAQQKKLSGIPGQGRPKNSKDKKKRKQKRVLVRTAASAWAKQAQKNISDVVTPVLLKLYGRANMRQTTTEEARKIENYKFNLLLQFQPFADISSAQIELKMRNPQSVNENIHRFYTESVGAFIEQTKTEPTIDQLRDIQCSVYIACRRLSDGED